MTNNPPRLGDLPSPPPGRTGFPWTEESPSLPQTRAMPRVSIVTPSFNQARFLEETIRSVLLQGYPNLEYFVIDGGSTDGSVEIIRKYAPWLSDWVSEPDEGQIFAIKKGWSQSTGEILAYLNSDDTYLPGAVFQAVKTWQANDHAPAVCGGELLIDAEGMVIQERLISQVTWHSLIASNFVPQPAIFLRRNALTQAGGLDTQYRCSFDYELWIRIARQGDFAIVPVPLATTRWHSQTVTLTQRARIAEENQRIISNILNGSLGQGLSHRERNYVQARLNHVLCSIYLDDPAKYAFQLLSKWVSIFLLSFSTAPTTTKMILSNFYYRMVLFYLHVIKHKDITQLRIVRGKTGIHWSEWQSRCEQKI
jgi:glycosyltransferase involved in cell wall biosynthesis